MRGETAKGFATKQMHARSIADGFGAVTFPVYRTSTYKFSSTDICAGEFEKTEDPSCTDRWYVYARSSNPSTAELEERYAALHGCRGAVAYASGVGAINAALFIAVSAGDHIVYSDSTYSATSAIMGTELPRFGVETTAVDFSDPAAVEAAIRPNTKVLYTETIANPAMKVTDLRALAGLGRKYGITTMTDNTFAGAWNCRPAELGIDVVIESMTKYASGHGDCVGGIVLTNDERRLYDLRMRSLLNLGSVMAPDTAFLIVRGLKTMELRCRKHAENAQKLAEFLEQQPQVEQVLYPGLPSHENYGLAKEMLTSGGGMISVVVKGGREGGRVFMNHLDIASIAVSLGDTETLVEHPASMTHIHLTEEELEAAGIAGGMIRISVGLESIDDLIEDFGSALKAIGL